MVDLLRIETFLHTVELRLQQCHQPEWWVWRLG